MAKKRKGKGRMTNAQRDLKMLEVKNLYLKHFSPQTIYELTGVTAKTQANWRDDKGWEHERELNNIRPSEIKKMILEYVAAVKRGETPPYKADDLAKVASAFDRFSDARKKAVYAMETLDDLAGFMLEEAAKAKGKARSEQLEAIKSFRLTCDAYVTKLLMND